MGRTRKGRVDAARRVQTEAIRSLKKQPRESSRRKENQPVQCVAKVPSVSRSRKKYLRERIKKRRGILYRVAGRWRGFENVWAKPRRPPGRYLKKIISRINRSHSNFESALLFGRPPLQRMERKIAVAKRRFAFFPFSTLSFVWI